MMPVLLTHLRCNLIWESSVILLCPEQSSLEVKMSWLYCSTDLLDLNFRPYSENLLRQVRSDDLHLW